ncbi:hypothetical protein ABDD95_24130 [Mucilaginibacter sp. PAMB04274]|uniref:hypothetical protein n=1 Tax=Mucilaginibacter sp. PAMB04274 TaxID=3138568 RepID=UPI003326492C
MKYLIGYLSLGILSMYVVAFRHSSFWNYLLDDSRDSVLHKLPFKEKRRYYAMACLIAVLIWPFMVVRMLSNDKLA